MEVSAKEIFRSVHKLNPKALNKTEEGTYEPVCMDFMGTEIEGRRARQR